jgi:hypothetical protein
MKLMWEFSETIYRKLLLMNKLPKDTLLAGIQTALLLF